GAVALPPDHDDDGGGDARRAAAGDRVWRGLGAAPPARDLDRRRPPPVTAPDALHDPGRLSLSRSGAALGHAPPRRAPRAATRRMNGIKSSSRRRPGPMVPPFFTNAGRARRSCEPRSNLRAGRWAPAFAGVTMLLAGCTVGPDYQRPAAPVPVAYK